MIRATIVFALASAALAGAVTLAGAQTAQVHQPYAGMESRALKALSEQQIADLRAGRGMGLALPAELNGYPGPVHVLELAEALALTADQRARTQQLFDAMKAETVPLGERLVQHETELDGLFASKAVRPASLEAVTAAIGGTQGTLRAAHLRYHLAMMDVLTPEQLHRYGALRGYGAGAGAHQGGHAGQHGHGTTHRP
jgi:Spy/CpxP family protein refolding chaperone